MKRFLIFVMAFLVVSNAFATRCGGWEGEINFYLFSPFEKPEDSPQGAYYDFWKSYVGDAELNVWDINSLKWADVVDSDNIIVATARKKNDKEMLDYIKDLSTYLSNNSDHYNEWNYPTAERMAEIRDTYSQLLGRAKAYKGTRLKDRYMLMAMRCMFQLQQYDQVQAYWNSHASKATDQGCLKTMKGLYAGALYSTKKDDEAARIFMELGDRQSLKYCLDDKRNLKGIKSIYEKDNNSPVLAFLIEDFVNMYQENLDGDQLISDYYSISYNEAREFIVLADKVVSGKKTNNPLLWKEAAALLSSYLGNDADADRYIAEFARMGGSQRLMDNARVIKFFQFVKTKSYKTDPDYVVSELKWLKEMSGKVSFFYNANERISNLLYDKLQNDPNTAYLFRPSAYELFEAPLDKVLSLREFLKNTKKMDNLQKYLYSTMVYKPADVEFDDVLGTRCIGKMDFDKAIEYLQKVPAQYYANLCLGYYMNVRSYNKASWDELPEEISDYVREDLKVSKNQRLEFCKDIKNLTAKYNAAKGDDKCRLAYELATMYQSATHWGGCWYMSHYYWSVYGDDDDIYKAYEKKTIEYLNEAAKSSDGKIKSSALYAKAWVIWHDYEYFWNRSDDGITPEMESSMEALCKYWDGVYGKGEWTMPCDYVMDFARSR